MSEDNTKKWQDIASQSQEELESSEEHNKQNDSMAEDASILDEDTINSGLEHPSYKELEDKLTAAEQKAHENWEKSVRAMAELDNVRRRAQKDVESAHKYGLEKLIKELLPVIDSLEQAMQMEVNEEEAVDAMKKGIELTLQLFLSNLEKFDVKQLDPIGEQFNPNQHEAISMQENNEAKANSILMVFQKGYLLADRVIRPARVIVAKGGQ